MLISSRKIGLSLSALFLISGTAWSAAIQGNVKGPDGKALKGAEVRIERKDKSASAASVKTDAQGRYEFKNLEAGTYKLLAASNGMAATASDNIKTRNDGAVRVDFNLKTQTVAGAPKKKTHKVWVHADTGTNIGGKWVDVADDEAAPVSTSTSPGANNVSKAGNSFIRSAQQGAGSNTHGGN